jgi:hypothetical protein
MDNLQLESILLQTKCHSSKIRVLSSDQLKTAGPLEEGHVIISNTDISTKPGWHWVLLVSGPHRGLKKVINYFDPLGENSFKHGKFKQFFSNYDLIVSNKGFPVQHTLLYSDTCGLICSFAAKLFCDGWKFNDIMQLFDVSGTPEATNINECFILTFMLNRFVSHASDFKKLTGCY